MNVYDFDKTIFDGDAEDCFFSYLFRDRRLFAYRVNYLLHEALFRLKLISKTYSREQEYRILRRIDDLDAVLKAYWDEHACRLMPWYLENRRPDDVIATGTPRFLMEPIIARMGFGAANLVATDMDRKTGKVNGLFAVGEPKVAAFQKQYPLDSIDDFYSDAWSDHYLAAYAKRAFIVHGDAQRTEWNEYFKTHKKK